MKQLNVKDIQKSFYECVRKETIKANKDAFGIEWL